MPTKWRIRSIPVLSLLLCCAVPGDKSAFAADAPMASIRSYPARGTVRFFGTSTLHNFGGELPVQPFHLTLSNGTWSASADVLSGQMATASEGRDRNMHRMLATNEYPQIHGEVGPAPVPSPGLDGTNAILRLKIRDQTQALPVQIRDWKETSHDIQFHAAWDVSLKQYGLKAPSVAGIVRVGDRVKLEADVVATKDSPKPRTHLINKEGLRQLLGTGWLGATKEHSRQGSVTEEHQRQPVLSNRPFGLPFFTTIASLLVRQRSQRIFSFLAPRGGGKSQATQPLPIYEMGSNVSSP